MRERGEKKIRNMKKVKNKRCERIFESDRNKFFCVRIKILNFKGTRKFS